MRGRPGTVRLTAAGEPNRTPRRINRPRSLLPAVAGERCARNFCRDRAGVATCLAGQPSEPPLCASHSDFRASCARGTQTIPMERSPDPPQAPKGHCPQSRKLPLRALHARWHLSSVLTAPAQHGLTRHSRPARTGLALSPSSPSSSAVPTRLPRAPAIAQNVGRGTA